MCMYYIYRQQEKSMRTYFECLPCFVNQALGVLRRCGATDVQTKNVMRLVFSRLAGIDFNASPPETATIIYQAVNGELGVDDPYREEKQRFNRFATELLPELQKRYAADENDFGTKVRLSIAANIIDFGKDEHLAEEDVLSNFERAMSVSMDSSVLQRLYEAVTDADRILFLCDNAGEIVFDRQLIEAMPHRKITCAVRGRPVINDATYADAHGIGLTALVPVISNGSDAPGTILHKCSDEFKRTYDAADLVIAKGQGNFETLSGNSNGKRIFFLLQVKCPIVARDVGYSVGSLVVADSASMPLVKTT